MDLLLCQDENSTENGTLCMMCDSPMPAGGCVRGVSWPFGATPRSGSFNGL